MKSFFPASARVSFLLSDEEGRELVSVEPEQLLMPASNLKVATAAAALRCFGSLEAEPAPRSLLFCRGKIERGIVHGDVELRCFGALDFTGRFRGDFDARSAALSVSTAALIDLLRRLDIREIRGDLILSSDLAEMPMPEYPCVSPYLWHENTVEIDTGDRFRRLPEDEDFTFEWDASLSSQSRRSPSLVALPLGPSSDFWRRENFSPAALLRRELKRCLAAAGIPCRGVSFPVAAPVQIAVLTPSQPSLRDWLKPILFDSDNCRAELLGRHVARRAICSSWLPEIAAGGVLADGSGLSRDSRLSARQLVDLHLAMRRQFPAWSELFPLAGRDGTLRQRFRGGPWEGEFRGKTGSLNGVTSLSGSLADGRCLAILIEGADNAAAWKGFESLALELNSGSWGTGE